MGKIVNESNETRPQILGERGMFEHRALWIYFLLQEAKKKGNVDWEELRQAIYNCGSYQGAICGKPAAAAIPARPLKMSGCRIAASPCSIWKWWPVTTII